MICTQLRLGHFSGCVGRQRCSEMVIKKKASQIAPFNVIIIIIDISGHFDRQPHTDRSCRSNSLSAPAPLYQHQARQCNTRSLVEYLLEYQFFCCLLDSAGEQCLGLQHVDDLIGVVVKTSALRAEDPGFDSHLRCEDFSGSRHTGDLTSAPQWLRSGAWHHRVSDRTGWPGVSIL